MNYSNHFCGNKKLPKNFFFSAGIGESDHALYAGAKAHAMKKADLHEYQLSPYPSILPENVQEMGRPEDLPRGSQLRVILSEASCERGEEASAGIMTAKLYRKTSKKEHGSIACDFGGKYSKEQLYQKLKLILDELYMSTYAHEFDLGEIRCEIETIRPTMRFGMAVVALCFADHIDATRSHCDIEHRFLGFRCDEAKANYMIQPVPFDSNQKGQKGAKEAPCAILAASMDLEPYHIETDQKTYLAGFYTKKAIQENKTSDLVEKVKQSTLQTIQKGKLPITIGGSHNSMIGALYGAHEFYGKEFSVLQLDAQTDLRKSFDGDPCHSACVMTHAKECAKNIMQVGIRSMSSPEKDCIDYDFIAFASDIHNDPLWVEDVMADLEKKVYITIDLSVFDSSYLMTSKPIPGGLQYQQVLKLLKTVAKKHEVIGFDVTELIPVEGNHAGEFLATRLIYDLVSYIEAEKK